MNKVWWWFAQYGQIPFGIGGVAILSLGEPLWVPYAYIGLVIKDVLMISLNIHLRLWGLLTLALGYGTFDIIGTYNWWF